MIFVLSQYNHCSIESYCWHPFSKFQSVKVTGMPTAVTEMNTALRTFIQTRGFQTRLMTERTPRLLKVLTKKPLDLCRKTVCNLTVIKKFTVKHLRLTLSKIWVRLNSATGTYNDVFAGIYTFNRFVLIFPWTWKWCLRRLLVTWRLEGTLGHNTMFSKWCIAFT